MDILAYPLAQTAVSIRQIGGIWEQQLRSAIALSDAMVAMMQIGFAADEEDAHEPVAPKSAFRKKPAPRPAAKVTKKVAIAAKPAKAKHKKPPATKPQTNEAPVAKAKAKATKPAPSPVQTSAPVKKAAAAPAKPKRPRAPSKPPAMPERTASAIPTPKKP